LGGDVVKKKIIAYICIVMIVFLFMYFRQSIYYFMNERDGFYIDIGHEPNDAIVDIAFEDDLYILSRSRAKSGSVSYHAFTILSREIEVLREVNLDKLVRDEDLLEIEELVDLLVVEDIYILYRAIDQDGEERLLVLRLAKDGSYLGSYEGKNIVSEEILLYEEDLVFFIYEEDQLSYLVLDQALEEIEKRDLYQSTRLTLQDAKFYEDNLYLLLDLEGQYALYAYDLLTEESLIGAVDPKIKEIVVGEDLYLLEYSGDYITYMYRLGEDVLIEEEIEVPRYRYYDALYNGESLYFYGGVTTGDELHAAYGVYDGEFTNQVLDVPYNNHFLLMEKMNEGFVFVMRTNYLMDYQIRKTIYTEDDVLYVLE